MCRCFHHTHSAHSIQTFGILFILPNIMNTKFLAVILCAGIFASGFAASVEEKEEEKRILPIIAGFLFGMIPSAIQLGVCKKQGSNCNDCCSKAGTLRTPCLKQCRRS